MDLIKKIENKKIISGIIGLGYVGIPLAVAISEASLKVIGFDIDARKVELINSGNSPIKNICDHKIKNAKSHGFEATTDFNKISHCDVIIICVPTPLKNSREPDLSFVIKTMEMISEHLNENQLLSLESTTWPGTTKEILSPYITNQNLKIGENFFLVYSPEREDPGNSIYKIENTPKIIGGITDRCLKVGKAYYGTIIKQIVSVTSSEAAEMVKLLENIHRSVNIGLVNEMKMVCETMKLDIFEIIDAAKTKPFGFTAFYPGPGVGGHCIPVDPFYLTWKAREFGINTKFIELAGEVNASMPQYVLDRTIYALNKNGKSVRNSKVLVLGIAYKPDVDDTRESPSVLVMELLKKWGAKVSYSDPNIPKFPEMRRHSFKLKSVKLSPRKIRSYDVVILLTDHTDFNYDAIRNHAKILLDTRGKFRDDPTVIRA